MNGGEKRLPWQAAYTAFCCGAPQDEISQIFSIPFETLTKRMQAENWAALRAKLPLATTSTGNGAVALPAKTEAKLALIAENRTENLKAFAKLRDHAVKMVDALADGTLKLEKQFNNPKAGTVTRVEVEPGPADWLNIATYLRTIADGTYRALGDFQAQEKPGSDALAGATTPSGPAITIILPLAIAQPREMRECKGEVIDLQPVTAPELRK